MESTFSSVQSMPVSTQSPSELWIQIPEGMPVGAFLTEGLVNLIRDLIS